MSKFNNRVLWNFPQIEPIQSFKDSILTLLTSFQQTIIQILKTIQHQFQINATFRNIVFTITLVSVIVSLLKYVGKRKHSLYRKQGSCVQQINKCTQSVKVQIDVMRKYILNYLGEQGNIVGDSKVMVKEDFRGQEINDEEIQQKFENLKKVLGLYEYCVKSNNKFNQYFLDEFVKVFAQLKELRKSKGIRSSSKRKDGETRVNTLVEKPKETKVPAVVDAPSVPVLSTPPVQIVPPATTPITPPTVPVRNGPRVPSASKLPSKKPPQPVKQLIKPIIEFTEEPSTSEVQTKQQPSFQNPSNQEQDKITNEFNTSEQINNSSPFSEPFSNPYTDSTFQSSVQTHSRPQISQTIIKPQLQASESTAQPNQQQIPDDPILSIPPAPSAKHSLPSLPIKPKREIPAVGGRRPPPPPRK